MSAIDDLFTQDNAAHGGCSGATCFPSSWPLEPWNGNCGRMECDEMIRMTPIEGFPETDNDTEAELAAWELLRDARAELETLRDAVRNFRDVKGRFHTQLAAERLIALLPENARAMPPGDGVANESKLESL
jgi:hypothetical protein